MKNNLVANQPCSLTEVALRPFLGWRIVQTNTLVTLLANLKLLLRGVPVKPGQGCHGGATCGAGYGRYRVTNV